MQNLTSAEVVWLQEHMRQCLSISHLLQHCINETNDQEFRQFCQSALQQNQQGIQRLAPMMGLTGPMGTH